MSLNKVMLIGNLGKSPELRYTPAGKAVCTMSLATTETWLDNNKEKQSHTEWHNLVIWGNRAETASKHLNKGSKIYVEGRIRTRSWDGKDGEKQYRQEIIVSEFQFLDRLAKKDQGRANVSEADIPEAIPEEDLPF